MGTNNPSEDQLALVEQRIIALADTIVDPGLPMESDSYFDEHGFDLESAAGQLAAKLKTYCKNAEVEPSLEDHPQVRRMARYLLENVDYEILEAPLSKDLMQMKDASSSKASGATTGSSKTLIYVGLAFLVLFVCAALFVMLGGGGSKPEHQFHALTSGGGGGRGGRKWRNDRNDSA